MTPMMATRGLIKTIIHADLRNGICSDCNMQMKIKDVDIGGGKIRKRAVCPECGGWGQNVGQLIARPYSIQAPDPPQCLSPKCLATFMKDSLFVALLSSYHRRRVAYAVANRPENGKKILERYRTGEPSPKNLWQAIHANIKLKCPVCRKYNVDPLLTMPRGFSLIFTVIFTVVGIMVATLGLYALWIFIVMLIGI